MRITTTDAWLKVQLELDGVAIALLTTDDMVLHLYEMWKALTISERDFFIDYVNRRWPAMERKIRWE